MIKRARKGFTLIEMLVVIAIIAVLVSVVIPIVSSASERAKAAANASNLRAIEAEATADYLLQSPENDVGYIIYNPEDMSFTKTAECPKCKKCGEVDDDADLFVYVDKDNNKVSATFGGKSVSYFADLAN